MGLANPVHVYADINSNISHYNVNFFPGNMYSDNSGVI